MDINGKIILVSNRDVHPKETTVKLFGENLNAKGAEQLFDSKNFDRDLF
ncbi:hypothetical protein [Colwellia sp. 75C3]|nr:hypothetical protein [Colwellia sp. 75C3]